VKDTYFVGVRPDGTIMGPCGKDRDYVEQCMVVGYSRASGKCFENDDQLWAEVKRLGYSVRECKIVLIQ
jgi:hypothetical protein